MGDKWPHQIRLGHPWVTPQGAWASVAPCDPTRRESPGEKKCSLVPSTSTATRCSPTQPPSLLPSGHVQRPLGPSHQGLHPCNPPAPGCSRRTDLQHPSPACVTGMVPRVQLGSACAEPAPRASPGKAPNATAPSSSACAAPTWSELGPAGRLWLAEGPRGTTLPALPLAQGCECFGGAHTLRQEHRGRGQSAGTPGWGGWDVPWAHGVTAALERGCGGSDGTRVPPVCPHCPRCTHARACTRCMHTHTPCNAPARERGRAERKDSTHALKEKKGKSMESTKRAVNYLVRNAARRHC